MDKIGYLYETPTEIITADRLPLLCKKGMKLTVVEDCFDERYLHERSRYYRDGLKEKKLTKGNVIEVLGCWMNFYGCYIKCTSNNETYDVDPKNLSFSWELNREF